MLLWTFYLSLGLLAGLMAGLLGIGGGVIIVPALYFQLQQLSPPPTLLMQSAVGSSLAVIVVTATLSTWTHHRSGAVDWHIVADLAPGICLGSLLGASLLSEIPGSLLRIILGGFQLAVALQLLLGLQASPERNWPATTTCWLVSLCIGTVSVVLGIGGGTLSVPFLLFCNIPLRRAIATGAALGVPIALVGGVSVLWQGDMIYWPAVAGVVVGTLISTGFGARLTHRLPTTLLRPIFGLALLIVGLRLLLRD